MINFLCLFILLFIIVWVANLFCNSLEHLGENLKISDGVTGSIFAAVGTALPETLIPIIALFSNKGGGHNQDIGVGAILGAPFMLSTLSLFVMAIFTIKKRGWLGRITPHFNSIKRDLRFFLFCYILAFVSILIPITNVSYIINIVISVILGFSYFIYILMTFRESKILSSQGNITTTDKPLLLAKILKIKNCFLIIILQLFFALLILLITADYFIIYVNKVSDVFHVSSFLIALVIIPIATEMPEKINSIIWLKENKDTLAIANITGAMVFQGALLPIIGILFCGNWNLGSKSPLFSIICTIFASIWFYHNIIKHNIRLWHFVINGLIYMTCIVLIIIYN